VGRGGCPARRQVGMYGSSYVGPPSGSLPATAPPHLATIVSGQYRLGLLRRVDVPGGSSGCGRAAVGNRTGDSAAQTARTRTTPELKRGCRRSDRWMNSARSRTCRPCNRESRGRTWYSTGSGTPPATTFGAVQHQGSVSVGEGAGPRRRRLVRTPFWQRKGKLPQAWSPRWHEFARETSASFSAPGITSTGVGLTRPCTRYQRHRPVRRQPPQRFDDWLVRPLSNWARTMTSPENRV